MEVTVYRSEPTPMQPSTDSAQPTLRRAMGGREYFTLAFGSIVGVGWVLVIDDWLMRGGSVGAMLGFLIGGLALLPVAAVYGRLAARLPEAGSEVAYTAAVFPRSISFAAGWAMTFTYLIVCPYEAVAAGRIAGYLFPALNTVELYQVAGYPVYLPTLVLGIGLTLGITFLNYRGIHFSSAFQNLTTFGLLATFAVFAPLGFWRGSTNNLPPLFAHSEAPAGALLSVLAVLQIAPYFLNGFETVPKCAEEAAPGFAAGGFGRMMVLALVVATAFYVIVVAVVTLLQPWPELVETNFPTAVAFRRAFGWDWLVNLILAGVVLSLLKVYNGNFLAATRMLYAMGRHDLLGGQLAAVDTQCRTPARAVFLVGGFAALSTLLGRSVLVPISEVGSLTCALGWLASSLAFCAGAAGRLSCRAWLVGSSGVAVSATLAGIAVWGFGPYHLLALGGWAVLGAVLWYRIGRLPEKR
jgi:amino acid transporter